MHPLLQAKLLRAIQEREIDRVGGSAPVKVDIRVLATSNRDMMKAVKEGQFREDLYFRLNVINIDLPPLRDRPGDVEVLAAHFIDKYAKANGLKAKPFSPESRASLLAHRWAGNVRELENTMHRAVLLSQEDEIQVSDIFLNAPDLSALKYTDSSSSLVGRTMADVEKDLIVGTLDHCLGNRTHAANVLGISIRTLRNKLRQYEDEGLGSLIPDAYRTAS